MFLLIKLTLIFSVSFFLVYTDVRYRQLPNNSVFFLFVILLLTSDFKAGVGIQFFVVICIFVLGFVLFLLDVIAAGDIKLFMAFSVGINPTLVPLVCVGILMLGGLLAILMLVTSKITKYNVVDRGVPYGVPIVISCLFGLLAS